jgi:hypothetical protein
MAWGGEEERRETGGLPHMYATSSWVTGSDPFGPAVRPEQRLGTSVIHIVSSWTGMTQQHKFEDRSCILLFEKILISFSHKKRCGFKEAQGRDSIKDKILLEVIKPIQKMVV